MNRAANLAVFVAGVSDAPDDCFLNTAKWLCRHLLKMDWVSRHQLYFDIVQSKPARFVMHVNALMGPDQLMRGTLTGAAAPTAAIAQRGPRAAAKSAAVAQRAPARRVVKQLKITDFFQKQHRL
jgi:hypothetical protein